MILTVTLNPAWDVTYSLPSFVPGAVNRVQTTHRRPGGKGVNVAAVLARLGTDVVATGLSDDLFADALAPLGITDAFVRVLPLVRSTLVVAEESRTTSLWELGTAPPDPAYAEKEVLRTVEDLLPRASALVVSGSLPPGVAADLPARLGALGAAAGLPSLLDTSGDALVAAAGTPGVVLLPNEQELSELVGSPVTSLDDVVSASAELLASGPSAIFATRGSAGLVVTTAAGSWLVPVAASFDGNPTGAGDAAAAAVARALSRGLDHVAAGCDAVALAATAVLAPVAGEVDPELFRRLRASVSPVRL